MRRAALAACAAGAIASGTAQAAWIGSATVDPFDDEVTTFATLPDADGDGVRVGLRCDAPADGGTELMLVFGHDETLAEPSAAVTVKLRVDRHASRELEARLFVDSDRSGYTTIARDGEAFDLDHLAVVEELRRGDAGVVGFEVYGARPWHPFTLDGAADAMDPVLAACGIPDPGEPIRRAVREEAERAQRLMVAKLATVFEERGEILAERQRQAERLAEHEARRRAAAAAKAARQARERAAADAAATGERGRLEREAAAAIVAAEAEMALRAADATRRDELAAAERRADMARAEERRAAERRAEEERADRERQAARAERVKAATLERARQAYLVAIRARLERTFRRPPGHRGPIDCTLRITQSRGGVVLRAAADDCAGGDASIAGALERAALAASPLPRAPDARVFDRRIALRWSS